MNLADFNLVFTFQTTFAAVFFVVHAVDDVFDLFFNLLRYDAVFFVKFNLFFTAAFGFVDGGFHGVGDFVGVQNRDAVYVARGAAYGLNQAAVRAQEAFFVGVEDGDEGDLGDVEAFAQEVDADQYVKQSKPQISNDSTRSTVSMSLCR